MSVTTKPGTAALSSTDKGKGKARAGDSDAASKATGAEKKITTVEDVSSPGELTVFVDNLLASLEGKFEEMSADVLGRMTQMSVRIDNLETAIQDLMSGGIEGGVPEQAAISKSS